MYFLIVIHKKGFKPVDIRLTVSLNEMTRGDAVKRKIAAILMNNGICELDAVDAAEWADGPCCDDVYRSERVDIYASATNV